MPNTYPGMIVEITKWEKGCSRILFDGLFAAGGISLSQVSALTGLEPYQIQNWVKRGFVTSPVKRLYSRRQFARIVLINMLRSSLQIEKICDLIKIIAGVPGDESDDLISDNVLYHHYVDMLVEGNINPLDGESVRRATEAAAESCEERIPGSRGQLAYLFEVMLYAHAASKFHRKSEEAFDVLQKTYQ